MLACVYGWVHQLAQVLDDAIERSVEERQLGFQVLLLHMQRHAAQLRGVWPQMIAHFLKVTQSYGPHLFFCYQVPDLPRTNNESRAILRSGTFP